MISRRENSASRWALRSRCVVLPDSVRAAMVVVEGNQIAEILEYDAPFDSLPVEDVEMLLPGLVDTHVHINEPGRTDWEGFATATRAAAAGGITTLIDMPLNSSPVTTTVEALQLKRIAAKNQIHIDCGFHGGLVPGNIDDVYPLIDAGICAFKAFLCPSGIDEFPPVSEADLLRAMPILADARIPLFVHAELPSSLPPAASQELAEHPQSYRAWLRSRPPQWECDAIGMLIQLAGVTQCHVHIVHLSAAEECLPLINNAKRRGIPITVETCPHYLNFCAEEIPDANPLFKCAPPIRGRRQRDRLRAAVAKGEIDTIGSDHSPCPPELKCLFDGDLSRAWGGIASLQLSFPLTRDLFESTCSEWDLVRLFATNPAQLVGLGHRKGAIVSGFDADLVVFDGTDFCVSSDMLHHRHKHTPYVGMWSSGMVERTYLRGQLIYDRGKFIGGPRGQLLERPRT